MPKLSDIEENELPDDLNTAQLGKIITEAVRTRGVEDAAKLAAYNAANGTGFPEDD